MRHLNLSNSFLRIILSRWINDLDSMNRPARFPTRPLDSTEPPATEWRWIVYFIYSMLKFPSDY
jgi:hypothetical protein